MVEFTAPNALAVFVEFVDVVCAVIFLCFAYFAIAVVKVMDGFATNDALTVFYLVFTSTIVVPYAANVTNTVVENVLRILFFGVGIKTAFVVFVDCFSC